MALNFHYHQNADVLYIAVNSPVPAVSYELDTEETMLRVSEPTGDLVGWTLVGLTEYDHHLPLRLDRSKPDWFNRNDPHLLIRYDQRADQLRAFLDARKIFTIDHLSENDHFVDAGEIEEIISAGNQGQKIERYA